MHPQSNQHPGPPQPALQHQPPAPAPYRDDAPAYLPLVARTPGNLLISVGTLLFAIGVPILLPVCAAALHYELSGGNLGVWAGVYALGFFLVLPLAWLVGRRRIPLWLSITGVALVIAAMIALSITEWSAPVIAIAAIVLLVIGMLQPRGRVNVRRHVQPPPGPAASPAASPAAPPASPIPPVSPMPTHGQHPMPQSSQPSAAPRPHPPTQAAHPAGGRPAPGQAGTDAPARIALTSQAEQRLAWIVVIGYSVLYLPFSIWVAIVLIVAPDSMAETDRVAMGAGAIAGIALLAFLLVLYLPKALGRRKDVIVVDRSGIRREGGSNNWAFAWDELRGIAIVVHRWHPVTAASGTGLPNRRMKVSLAVAPADPGLTERGGMRPSAETQLPNYPLVNELIHSMYTFVDPPIVAELAGAIHAVEPRRFAGIVRDG